MEGQSKSSHNLDRKSSSCRFTYKRAKRVKERRLKKSDEQGSSSSSSEDDTEVVVSLQRERKEDPLVQRSRLFKKHRVEEHGEEYHKEGGCSTVQSYQTSGAELVNQMKENTVAIREIDTDMDRDQRKIEERREEVHKELEGKEDDKIYRGLNNYAEYVPKKEPVQGKRLATKGPIRAPTNIRTTVRWDYEPDTCKDWRETGICGFGLSCKFAHDRGDYKFGWQLERDFEEKQRARDYGEEVEEESDDDKYVINSSDEEALPRKCPLCRKSFTSPVVTRCHHYFCEECALNHYKNSTRCYACGKQTTGVFNPAKDLVERIKKRVDAGRTYSSESEDDTPTLPDESEPKEKSPIPEDDPEYFMKMRDPYLDGHKVPKYLNKPVQTFIGRCISPTISPVAESLPAQSGSERKPGLPRVDIYKKVRPKKEKKPKPIFVPQDDDVD